LTVGLGLVPLTVPEVRRLLVALVWTTPVEPGFVLAWSRWRRRAIRPARAAPTTSDSSSCGLPDQQAVRPRSLRAAVGRLG
jgi:hypothetical protein